MSQRPIVSPSSTSIENSLKARCEQALLEPNRDIPSWTCPLCPGVEATRAHFVADHILGHIRRRENQRTVDESKRQIEVG